MLSFDEALARMLSAARPVPAVTLPLADAHRHRLAADVSARCDVPGEPRAQMDGYALRAADTGPGVHLRSVGLALAGAPWRGTLATGEAVRIMTGAVVPSGADAIVPLEELDAAAEQVRLRGSVTPGTFCLPTGSELRTGQPLLSAGTLLTPGALGLLATGGVGAVHVHRRVRVALLSTGDELIPPGNIPGPGQTVNSSRLMLATRLTELDTEVIDLGHCADRPDELSAALARAREADLLLTTGGVSIGDRDLVQPTLAAAGFERIFWRVAIRPGKPLLFGRLGTTLTVGLPGRPGSTAICFEALTVPLLRRLQGHPEPMPLPLPAKLADAVSADSWRTTLLPGTLSWEGSGYLFHPLSGQSGQHHDYAAMQALLTVAPNAPLAAGSDVTPCLSGSGSFALGEPR